MTDMQPRGDEELIIGARNISEQVFQGRISPRQVYRLASTDPGWPIFLLLGKLACRPGPMRAEIARREQAPK